MVASDGRLLVVTEAQSRPFDSAEQAYDPNGVALTLIRWMLSLTPVERIEHIQQAAGKQPDPGWRSRTSRVQGSAFVGELCSSLGQGAAALTRAGTARPLDE